MDKLHHYIFQLLIHDPEDRPLIGQLGLTMAPGTETFIGIHKNVVSMNMWREIAISPRSYDITMDDNDCVPQGWDGVIQYDQRDLVIFSTLHLFIDWGSYIVSLN